MTQKSSRWPTRTLAVDFDDVIHDRLHPKEGRRMGEPILGTKDALEQLKVRGWTILIHSCNRPQVIRDYMAYYQLPYDRIWEGVGKPAADFYCADRGIEIRGDWSEVLRKIDVS